MANKNAGDFLRGRTRYQPLVDYLAASDETEIVLSLAEIEEIMGGPLGTAVYVTPHAWTSPKTVYVRLWNALGWRAQLDRRNQYVTFTRDAEE